MKRDRSTYVHVYAFHSGFTGACTIAVPARVADAMLAVGAILYGGEFSRTGEGYITDDAHALLQAPGAFVVTH